MGSLLSPCLQPPSPPTRKSLLPCSVPSVQCPASKSSVPPASCPSQGKSYPRRTPHLLIWTPPATLPSLPPFSLDPPPRPCHPASASRPQFWKLRAPLRLKGSAPAAPPGALTFPLLSRHCVTAPPPRHAPGRLLWDAFSASLPLPILDRNPRWAPMIPCTSPMASLFACLTPTMPVHVSSLQQVIVLITPCG